MTKQEFENWLISKGYSKDKFGHYQKDVADETYRFKLSNKAARFERKVYIVDHNEWLRLSSGYYKNLSITPEGKLAGMKR